MPSEILLDTTVLIDALRNRNQRRSLLANLLHARHPLAISAMSLAEVYGGLRPGEEPKTRLLLNSFQCLPITASVATRAGGLKAELRRQGQTRTLADMLIAATALEHGLRLATDNRKDFAGTGVSLLDLP